MINFFRSAQVVATFEMGNLDVGNIYEPLKFRVEILIDQKSSSYFPRVYRWETFRVKPTFPLSETERSLHTDLADHEILVRDAAIEWKALTGGSVQEVLDQVEQRFRELFFLEDNSSENVEYS